MANLKLHGSSKSPTSQSRHDLLCKRFIPVYNKLIIHIGYGTYSTVFQARDLESGKIVALKNVRFNNFEPESVCFMAQKIMILRRLDHPNINKVGGINYFSIIMQHISGVLRT
ncbi:putative serine/threonine-protein kinase [Forsythia ovata]|uniref:Serine/threonine-protein kinase n=1 Tax=Forsythia ovata TaxID=205694 RepID=A0ABD1VJR3_9LAMI